MKTPETAPDNNAGRKTPAEIKKGLRCCVTDIAGCKGCPFDNSSADGLVWECTVDSSALAYIQQLESRLAQAERERDAAVVCIRHICEAINKPVRKVSDTSNNLMNAKQIALNYVIELVKGVCPENTKEAE